LVAGAVANRGPHGWRNIFWIEAGLHLVSSIGLLLLYNPPARPNQQKFHLKRVLWECDPIGSGLFVLGMTSLLIALNWGDGLYAWADPQVSTCLAVGILLLVIFAFYGERA
jgi:MFS family permease